MSFHDVYKSKIAGRNVCAQPPFPKKIKIEPCGVCDSGCIFCPTALQKGKHGNIDDELCRRIIQDAFNAGARELAFSASGEPLLNPKLENYISLAKDTGYDYVFINTNGALLNRQRAKTLLNSGLDSVKISINAGNAESYSLIHGTDCFENVIENVIFFDELRKKVLTQQCKLFVSFVAIKENLNEVELLRSKINKYVDDFIVSNANTRGGSLETAAFGNSLLGSDDYSFQYPCGQLFDTAVVLAEGYLVICCQDFDKLTVIADLREISIKEAWNCEKFVSFRKRYLIKDLEGTLCYNCLFGQNNMVSPLTPALAHYALNERKAADRTKRIEMLRNLHQATLKKDVLLYHQ